MKDIIGHRLEAFKYVVTKCDTTTNKSDVSINFVKGIGFKEYANKNNVIYFIRNINTEEK